MKLKLNKKVKVLLLATLMIVLMGIFYIGYTYDKHIVECKTDNFYFLYGTSEGDNTCILLKPSDKLSETERASLTEENEDTLLMVSDVISEEARENYIPSDKGIDIYGKQNVYVVSQGIGPLNHTYEKTMDVLYLTDNTAIKLGLKEGVLQETQDYLDYLEEMKKGSPSELEETENEVESETETESSNTDIISDKVGDVDEEK